MIRLASLASILLWFGAGIPTAGAAFSSLYVFGDGVCTTTNNENTGPDYYGSRYCNGRVWIEVLAQRQGLTYDAAKNWSYYGQDSGELITNVSHFTAPADATTALFVVWANDADFVYYMGDPALGPPYTSAGLPLWTNYFNLSLANHFQAVTNLYAKGARTLVMPNAVDIAKVPSFANMSVANRSFVRQRVSAYNSSFVTTLNQAKVLCPGLTIIVPDIFSLLDNVVTNAGAYGLTNTLWDYGQGNGGVSISALDYFLRVGLSANTNGLGTNFIFWDYQHPTAKMQEIIADTVQQLISPPRLRQLAPIAGNVRVDLVNVPIGLNGAIYTRTNLTQTNWTFSQTFSSTNSSQSVTIPTTGTRQFYQVRFPFSWSWP